MALFERVFRHAEFTGRSGTFFAYEGLGSVYWHMVSKLLFAVQETMLQATNEPTASALVERYADVRMGLGFNNWHIRFARLRHIFERNGVVHQLHVFVPV